MTWIDNATRTTLGTAYFETAVIWGYGHEAGSGIGNGAAGAERAWRLDDHLAFRSTA